MEDNGILAKLTGDVVADAGRHCPDAATSAGDCCRVVLDVQGFGPVEFTFVRLVEPRWRRPFWTCKRATPIQSR